MTKKNAHIGHRARLRDRVNKEGLDNFPDYQVLEYALTFVLPYKDTNPIAHALVDKFGSLAGVLEADIAEIASVAGMGEVSANFLTAIPQIYNIYEKRKVKVGEVLKTPNKTYLFTKKLFVGKKVEELYLISLNVNGNVTKVERISQGSASSSKVTIRKITDIISRNKVNNVIIAHNHPEGSATPSIEDDKFTKALAMCLALNDTNLVDHIIISDKDYYSYRRVGLIDKYRDGVAELLLTRHNSLQMAQYGDEEDEEE